MAKIVYILGAGFSKVAGAPLVDELLITARNLYVNEQNKLTQGDRDAFNRVFQYHKELSSARTKVIFDIDNIEELLSFIDINLMCVSIGKQKDNLISTRKALIRLILKTLDLTIDSKRFNPYYNFIEHLWTKQEEKVFITFNYDLILESAMKKGDCKYNYCLDLSKTPYIAENQAKLLKLHGSSNWLVCDNGNCTKLEIHKSKVLDEIYSRKCSVDGGNMVPLLIPPTWNKAFESDYIKSVWSNAYNEIKEATYLIFIGYSLPATDLYFRHFITLALKDNMSLRRISVVDVNDAVNDKYAAYIEENYYRRYFKFNKKSFGHISVDEMLE